MRNADRVPLRNGLIPGSDGRQPGAEGPPIGDGLAETPVDYVPDLMTEEALKWVGEHKDGPFFLYWSLVTPHANGEGTKRGRGQEVPDLGAYADQPWPKPDRAHAAIISRLDADAGRLFARLKELGLDENTLVIFTSDNGHHKEGGNNPELFDANGPLRGMKRDLTDGGIRMPTIARWPGKVPAGSVSAAVLWFADVLPTFASLAGAGAALPPKLDGLSFVPILEQQADAPFPARTLYWEFHEGGFSQAVLMDSRWKAIRNKRLDAPVAVYDLDSDIGEAHDLAAEKPGLVARAKELFTTARTDTPDWPIKEAPLKAPKK